jgi:hypothetical protein
MTTAITEAQSVIERYEWLLERAIKVVDGAPYWGYHYDVGPIESHIQIEGNTVILSAVSAQMDYDYCTLDRSSMEFPVGLLFLDDEELAAWKKEERRKYDEEAERSRRNKIAQKEAEERFLLAQLKAKYQEKA